MIGKLIGGCIYVHRDYLVEGYESWAEELPDGFEYTLVKVNTKSGAVTFIQCEDFDTAPEPTMGAAILVRNNGTYKRMSALDDPWIYHHKWQMVGADYQGFDVEESKARSAAWEALDVDRSRIGKKSYWEANVVPLI